MVGGVSWKDQATKRNSVSAWEPAESSSTDSLVRWRKRRETFVSPVHARQNRSVRNELFRWGDGSGLIKVLSCEIAFIAIRAWIPYGGCRYSEGMSNLAAVPSERLFLSKTLSAEGRS